MQVLYTYTHGCGRDLQVGTELEWLECCKLFMPCLTEIECCSLVLRSGISIEREKKLSSCSATCGETIQTKNRSQDLSALHSATD